MNGIFIVCKASLYVIMFLVITMFVHNTMVIIHNKKNINTYIQYRRIVDAIFDYAEDKKAPISEVIAMCNSMAAYGTTLFRWWDWGYTRILPKELFEKVKPYIK